MSSYRISRITEDIKRELADILRSVKDARVRKSLISIVKVKVTSDLSYAQVFVSSIDGLAAAKKAVEGLNSASGFIRHELGSRLEIRHVPALTFVPTDSIEYGAYISKVLREL